MDEQRPKIVSEEAFLKKKTFKIFTEVEEELNPDEIKKEAPLLLHIRADHNIDTITNVKPGPIQLKDSNGEKLPYPHIIEPRKTLNWKYKGVNIPIYLTEEKEFLGLPYDNPKADARTINMMFRRVKASDTELEEQLGLLKSFNMSRAKVILYFVAVLGGIILGFLFLWKTFDLGGALQGSKEAAQAITNTTAPLLQTVVNTTTIGNGVI